MSKKNKKKERLKERNQRLEDFAKEAMNLIDEAENAINRYEVGVFKDHFKYESPYEQAISNFETALELYQYIGWEEEAGKLMNLMKNSKDKKIKDDDLRKMQIKGRRTMDINQEEKLLKTIRKNLVKTKINDNTLEHFQNKMGWQGAGTEIDPIIINDLSGLKPKIVIKKTSLYYIIRDVVVYILSCINTQNIIIENCKIKNLEVEGCYDITIRNNSILNLAWGFSKGCTLKNNSFSRDVYESLESIKSGVPHHGLQKILYIVSSINLLLAFLIFTFEFNSWPFGILNLCSFALFFYFAIALKITRKRTCEKPENIIIGNLRLSNIGKEEIYLEILENYSYLGEN